VSGTIGRAFDARERASQAQELAFSALNIPTAADIERLTRRLRSVSQRLEGIEDGVHRLNRALSDGGVERRLAAMEEQLKTLGGKLSGAVPGSSASDEPRTAATRAIAAPKTTAKRTTAAPKTAAKRSAAKRAAPKRSTAASRTKKSA
jgi:hypothetical protein